MKLKTDFITNSSSTCFVVLIPEDYSVSDEELKRAIEVNDKEYYIEDDEECEPFEKIREDIDSALNSLKLGNEIYLDEYGNGDLISPRVYNILSHLIEDRFVITIVDMPGDGYNCYSGVKMETLMKVFLDNSKLQIMGKKDEE